VTGPRCTGIGQDRNRWRTIAAELRNRILAGHFSPGDRLPSSTALRERHGVSTQTVQNAMNALRSEGLIETRPGLGWFVRKPPDVVRLVRRPEPEGSRRRHRTMASLSGSETETWFSDVATTLRFGPAPADIAAELRIDEGADILVRERTISEDGRVLAMTSSFFARSLTRDTVIESADTGPGGVFARLIELGHRITRHAEQVTARLAEDEEAGRFACPDRPIVFHIKRTTLGQDSVLGAIHITALADRFTLCYELPVTPH
jgi:GntR family transcriptional regulator